MSTYICTFQDGSEALMHYGVLGMKWGRRKDGLPQGTQGFGRSRGLSDNQKKWIKRAAIGAGVIGLGAAAHFTGADRAILSAIRNYRPHGGIRGLARGTRGITRASGKLGSFGAKGTKRAMRDIGSTVKRNTSNLSSSKPRKNLSRLGVLRGQLASQREGAARIAARQKVDAGLAPKSILSSKGKARVSSVLGGRPKPPPIPPTARPATPKITTSFGSSLPTTRTPSGKVVQKVPASVYRRGRVIDANKAAQAAKTQAIRDNMGRNPVGRAYINAVTKQQAARNAAQAKASAQSTSDAAAAFLSAQQGDTKKKRRWFG